MFHAGLYAHSLGEFAAGITHFRAVLDREACAHLHPMAAATAALCELKQDSSQAGVGRAVELLEGVAEGAPDSSAWPDK
jgi:hypothetical protein